MLKRVIIFAVIQEILIFFLMLSFYWNISLLYYINVSFIVAAIVFVVGLILYVMQSGFFDLIHTGMRKITRRMRREEESEFADVPLSELMNVGYVSLLLSSLAVLATSFIALAIYYS
ncbi:DUF3899 domain-containing protein [Listeria sp. SHR_NRA_18]|uniref:DUF3899 domain-containing protein n=2 Tax=Listeria newyorkensis TaxID=1497681 RepID=A0A841YZ99_9LIST|nr:MULTISPECIES: DUF3899 domain-containing protein [Listeria]KGL37314.1 membrane protein [Listeriaceae bacterium FSL A5-0209]KGL37790.1 membrane protein [Listeria newyorkensis]MBC1458750.1 DUF3899 domain-containing protein [Listeria newyorkensis]RQW66083.1 DUF3899 domain-containing protein [Listeria sp. SHR_NRA_18]WAO23254.2 DUF3899 domain-containing protein [Listeria newyorkensis]